MRFYRAMIAAALVPFSASAALPNSMSVTTQPAVRPPGIWSVYYGTGDVSAALVVPPDGSPAMEFSALASGTIVAG